MEDKFLFGRHDLQLLGGDPDQIEEFIRGHEFDGGNFGNGIEDGDRIGRLDGITILNIVFG